MRAEFDYRQRKYICSISQTSEGRELRIQNSEGKVLAVQQGKRQGLLGISRETSEEVDVSKPFFYSLIRLALQTLETEISKQRLSEQEQILIEKNQIIHGKTEQIGLLQKQLELLQEQLSQLSEIQRQKLQQLQSSLQQKETTIIDREQHIEKLQTHLNQTASNVSPEKVEEKLMKVFGEKVWQQMETSSQNDLVSAYINYKTAKQRGFLDDYSESGVRLGFVIETEVISPFFRELYLFLKQRSICNLDGRTEIGGVKMGPKQEQTLGKLPRLIATQWTTFDRYRLDQPKAPQAHNQLYRQWNQDCIISGDRLLVKQFLQQWSHPLSPWLQQGEQAASLIDQVRELRNRASHPVPLYEWQFRLLWSIVIGETQREGILNQIYG